ncbi:MAG: tRNA epoxyqueuosine(34) reductase QueG [Burkholderiales bacterium]|jgi:epoxyqueuosine reductase|nr:tRNA epoxyqueuosine(34) reductase QueG [Burkholderiales bacterium]
MINYNILTQQILQLAPQFDFLEARIANIDIEAQTKDNFSAWLKQKFHGEMTYLARNTELRFMPNKLHQNTLSIISVKLPYLNSSIDSLKAKLNQPHIANVSSYAQGRDYHKVVKQKLNAYAAAINELLINYKLDMQYRSFTDSAPVLEVELAAKSGLGWRGKNTLLINKTRGSMFFLGEIFTNLPLTPTPAVANNCGTCSKCIDICPTKAIIAPYILDATKCISYLTIEFKGTIPLALRKLIGNRIYGCDDCQIFCPWNKFSQKTTVSDFKTRDFLNNLTLVDAFLIEKDDWEKLMQGSSILRIGYECWLRNVAVALGNSSANFETIAALKSRINYPSLLVQEHINWALEQLT